jgi:hypothetical protein
MTHFDLASPIWERLARDQLRGSDARNSRPESGT